MRKLFRILPPHVFLAGVGAEWLLNRYLPLAPGVPPRWEWVGWVLAGVAALLGILGAGLFRLRGTPVEPFHEAKVLVTSGVFRFTRNPMYLGLLTMLVAGAVVLGSLSPWVVPPLFVWILTKRFIAWEEATLRRIYGEAYDDYRRRVRRWI